MGVPFSVLESVRAKLARAASLEGEIEYASWGVRLPRHKAFLAYLECELFRERRSVRTEAQVRERRVTELRAELAEAETLAKELRALVDEKVGS